MHPRNSLVYCCELQYKLSEMRAVILGVSLLVLKHKQTATMPVGEENENIFTCN